MLVDGSTPGNDMRYIEKKVEAARNFANKLWNATRFVLMNLPEDFEPGLPCEELLDMSDKWVLTKLNQVAGAMTDIWSTMRWVWLLPRSTALSGMSTCELVHRDRKAPPELRAMHSRPTPPAVCWCMCLG